jgi:hypothetical protein
MQTQLRIMGGIRSSRLEECAAETAANRDVC